MSLTSYEIRNRLVIDLLEEFRYTYRELYLPEETNVLLGGLECADKADYYTGDDELSRVMDMKEDHEGFARGASCYAIKPEHYKSTHPEEYAKTWTHINDKMKTELGLQSSALSSLYPPGGYIGWHNNANASAHNLIFSWSESGDGWFKYVDPKTNEIITVEDKQGWQLKAGYFGAYGSGDVVYHAARTNCYRMTLSYVLGHNEDYWQDCIDYITEK